MSNYSQLHILTPDSCMKAVLTRGQRQQLRDGMIAEWRGAQRSRSNNTVQTSYDIYTVHKQIGAGGNGYVYKVTNSGGVELALKFLNPKLITIPRLRSLQILA